jgi:transposase
MTPNESYYERVTDSRKPQGIRRPMIRFFLDHGENVSYTARVFRTSRPTVTKWVKRYKAYGWKGLWDLPRGPHRCPHKTSQDHRELIANLRTNHGRRPKTRIGQEEIQLLLEQRYGIKMSSSTTNRVLHELKLTRPRRKKYQKKRHMARYRKHLRPLAHWQVDVKYLNDIPQIYALVLRRILPKFEYTMKDVLTGTTLICHALQLMTFNSAKAIAPCLDHFRSHGLDLSQITIQTDNGSEFIGSITAKRDSLFTRVVENFHGRIEDEFYDLERPNLNLKKTPFQAV